MYCVLSMDMPVKTIIDEMLPTNKIIIDEVETIQNKSDDAYSNKVLVTNSNEHNKNSLNIK